MIPNEKEKTYKLNIAKKRKKYPVRLKQGKICISFYTDISYFTITANSSVNFKHQEYK